MAEEVGVANSKGAIDGEPAAAVVAAIAAGGDGSVMLPDYYKA